MPGFVALMATTRPVTQGNIETIIMREALDSFAEQINADRAMRFTVEHDPSLMPIGKITEAWVEAQGNDYALMARYHVEDSYTRATHVASGQELVILSFEDDPRPFTSLAYGNALESGDALGVDVANFGTYEDYNRFEEDVRAIDNSVVCEQSIERRSIAPEPIIELVVSHPYLSAALPLGVWAARRIEKFISYTVDETLRKIGDDISDKLSRKLRAIIRAYSAHRKDDNRPTTIQLVVPGEPRLILLIRVQPDEDFPTINLAAAADQIEQYTDIMQGADNAVFERSGGDDWRFLYLTTKSGKVIGDADCCERTVVAHPHLLLPILNHDIRP